MSNLYKKRTAYPFQFKPKFSIVFFISYIFSTFMNIKNFYAIFYEKKKCILFFKQLFFPKKSTCLKIKKKFLKIFSFFKISTNSIFLTLFFHFKTIFLNISKKKIEQWNKILSNFSPKKIKNFRINEIFYKFTKKLKSQNKNKIQFWYFFPFLIFLITNSSIKNGVKNNFFSYYMKICFFNINPESFHFFVLSSNFCENFMKVLDLITFSPKFYTNLIIKFCYLFMFFTLDFLKFKINGKKTKKLNRRVFFDLIIFNVTILSIIQRKIYFFRRFFDKTYILFSFIFHCNLIKNHFVFHKNFFLKTYYDFFPCLFLNFFLKNFQKKKVFLFLMFFLKIQINKKQRWFSKICGCNIISFELFKQIIDLEMNLNNFFPKQKNFILEMGKIHLNLYFLDKCFGFINFFFKNVLILVHSVHFKEIFKKIELLILNQDKKNFLQGKLFTSVSLFLKWKIFKKLFKKNFLDHFKTRNTEKINKFFGSNMQDIEKNFSKFFRKNYTYRNFFHRKIFKIKHAELNETTSMLTIKILKKLTYMSKTKLDSRICFFLLFSLSTKFERIKMIFDFEIFKKLFLCWAFFLYKKNIFNQIFRTKLELFSKSWIYQKKSSMIMFFKNFFCPIFKVFFERENLFLSQKKKKLCRK